MIFGELSKDDSKGCFSALASEIRTKDYWQLPDAKKLGSNRRSVADYN
jgi:hypothetical protein